MTTTRNRPELWRGAAEHYGCRVAELGEDEGTYGVAGHPPERRALAAVLAYLRVDCGIPGPDVARWWDQPRIRRRYVAYVEDLDGERDGWVWADDDLREPMTVIEL